MKLLMVVLVFNYCACAAGSDFDYNVELPHKSNTSISHQNILYMLLIYIHNMEEGQRQMHRFFPSVSEWEVL